MYLWTRKSINVANVKKKIECYCSVFTAGVLSKTVTLPWVNAAMRPVAAPGFTILGLSPSAKGTRIEAPRPKR